MITIKDYIKKENKYRNFSFPDDVRRIVELLDSKGIIITPSEAEELWSIYSDDWCAGWLILPSNDNELFRIIIEQAKDRWGNEEE